MKNLSQFILKSLNESLNEDFLNQIISIFIAIGYTMSADKKSLIKDIELLEYFVEDTTIYFTIADRTIYGILKFDNGFASLSFRSIDNEFNETPCEKLYFDDMYILLSSGTLRDLINTENKEGIIKYLNTYKAEEVIDDNDY